MISHVHNNIFRGPRPTNLKQLASDGINSIINLESGFYEMFHEDKYETQFPCDFGIKEYNIPLSDFSSPDFDKVFLAINIMTKGEPTYIHCLHGKDRTGFVCAVYRMLHQGWSYEKARKEMLDYGFHTIPYSFWLYKLKHWEK